MSQLPSSHLSIHRVPAKLLDGVVPHGKNRCRLQLLFLCLIVTDPHSPVVVLIYSVDAIPLWLTVGLLQMQSVPDSIIYGFLFQNPVQSPMPPIGHSTEFWSVLLVYLCFLCCHRCLCFYRAFDIFQLFLRIICRPCLQDSVDHPQYLAGYHNQ